MRLVRLEECKERYWTESLALKVDTIDLGEAVQELVFEVFRHNYAPHAAIVASYEQGTAERSRFIF